MSLTVIKSHAADLLTVFGPRRPFHFWFLLWLLLHSALWQPYAFEVAYCHHPLYWRHCCIYECVSPASTLKSASVSFPTVQGLVLFRFWRLRFGSNFCSAFKSKYSLLFHARLREPGMVAWTAAVLLDCIWLCCLLPCCSKCSFILGRLLHDRKLVWQSDYVSKTHM